MAPRNIVLYGNCQVLHVARVFIELVAPVTGDRVRYFDMNFTRFDRPGVIAAFARADVLVDQVFDTPDPIPPALTAGIGIRLQVPNIRGDFLWPYGTREHHPLHAQFPPDARAYYSGEFGDSFLNRMVITGVPPEEAVARYMAVDFVRQRNLPRILELTLDRQRRRDMLAGIEVADFLAANLRSQKLFLSPGHPAEVLLNRITKPILAALLEPALVERVLCGQYVGFPAWRIAPVHPGVVRQLGLEYLPEFARFLVYDEAFLTFPEYAARYVRGETLPEFRAALREGRTAPPADTLGLIDRALQKAPMSPRAHQVRAHLLRQLRRTQEALLASLKAVSLEPENPQLFVDLVASYAADGQAEAAEGVARLALSKFPRHASVCIALCDLLAERPDKQEYAALLRHAIHLDPGNVGALLRLARHLLAAGELAEAEQVLRAVQRQEPKSQPAAALLSDVLERTGRLPEAIAALRGALAAAPADPPLHVRLGRLLERDGDLAGAEAAYRRSIELGGAATTVLGRLADLLHRQERTPEAVAELRAYLATVPGDARLQAHLARLERPRAAPAPAPAPASATAGVGAP
jgi:tetratricopeptide (TPR) repeat protein